MDTSLPDYLRVGQWVKILDWCGKIVDIAESGQAVLLKVESFKGVWNHHPTEWLEYRPGAIEPATDEQIAADAERFMRHLQRQMDAIAGLQHEQVLSSVPDESIAIEKSKPKHTWVMAT